MIQQWVEGLGLLLALWWLWEIRRAVGLRRPTRLLPRALQVSRGDFKGAVPPARFIVIRWPDGLYLYEGCVGALARTTFEYAHPGAGEEIELWELEHCRGHKSA